MAWQLQSQRVPVPARQVYIRVRNFQSKDAQPEEATVADQQTLALQRSLLQQTSHVGQAKQDAPHGDQAEDAEDEEAAEKEEDSEAINVSDLEGEGEVSVH